MASVFADYYRCDLDLDGVTRTGGLSANPEYFDFEGLRCYGRHGGGAVGRPGPEAGNGLLPFDLDEVVTNLREERYAAQPDGEPRDLTKSSVAHTVYYFVRPLLPVLVRRHLQRARLRGWERIPFPRWPVDFTVDSLMRRAMATALRAHAVEETPFVWFWPDGASSCAIMTHDVEATKGRDFCGDLMDLNDRFGIKSSFQIVPEVRYSVSETFLDGIRSRGFEVNVHDLNHDGRLYSSHRQFVERARRINAYGRAFGSRGFRAGAMYRRQDWFDALEFSYDMSVPNVAHLEPQRGGCCTVMPYFVGRVLELPLTTIQDYSLFHILGDYSTTIWKQQIELIRSRHGLISFITHPDYLIERRARQVYTDLLAHLRQLCEQEGVWMALPRDVDQWWRNRSQMRLVRSGDAWKIEGPDSHRASLAFATVRNGDIHYRLDTAA